MYRRVWLLLQEWEVSIQEDSEHRQRHTHSGIIVEVDFNVTTEAPLRVLKSS